MAKAGSSARKHVDEVGEAREVLARAEAAHARETARGADAQRELERLADELRDTDPDDVKFEKLASERDAARTRADALAEREEAARHTLERVRQALTAAERAAAKAKVMEIDAELRTLDETITREVREAYERLLGRIREARKLAAEANALGAGPVADAARGSRWAQSPLNKGALRWAVGALPDRVPGEEVQP